jgi:Cu+-exporting ATPase
LGGIVRNYWLDEQKEACAMQDPVCGMTVEPETAVAAWEHGEQVYYFCSVGCFERFKQDPQSFLDMDPSERGM